MTHISYDAAREYVTVISPEGVEESVIRLNAHDLVRTNGYRWYTTTTAASAIDPTTPVMESLKDVAAIAEATMWTESKAAIKESLATNTTTNAPLTDEAFAVAGITDVETYLKGFSVESLRTIAEERYGEKIHHRTNLEKTIARILELESDKYVSELDA